MISYRGRSAIREVGKAFGLSEDTIGALSSSIWGMGGGAVRESELARAGIDVASPRMHEDARAGRARSSRFRAISPSMSAASSSRAAGSTRWCRSMNGAMDERTLVEWDKDDLDALGILKVDVLGLGMLTCIRKAFDLVEKHYGDVLLRTSLECGGVSVPAAGGRGRIKLLPPLPPLPRKRGRPEQAGVR